MDSERGFVVTHWLYKQMRQLTEPTMVNIAGVQVIFFPGMFMSHMASGRILTGPAIDLVEAGERLLDMGAGPADACGFAKKGAKVTAIDINRTAVDCIQYNAARLDLEIDVRHGDLFQPLLPDECFDVMYFNHPFNWSDQEVSDMLDRAGFDYRYETIEAFIKGAKHHLAPTGRVLLGTGSIARLDLIEHFATLYGYSSRVAWKTTQPLEVGSAETLDFMILELKPVR